MLAQAFFDGLNNNIRGYGAKFRETGDLKWLVRYAQESKLLRKFAQRKEKSYYHPLTIAEFLDALRKSAKIPSKDPIQNALSNAVECALLRYYAGLDPRARALKHIALKPVEEALVNELWVGEKEIEEFNRLFIDEVGQMELKDDVQDQLLKIAQNEDQLLNGVKYVLTKAYLFAYDYNSYKNPILWVVDPEYLEGLLKTATTQKQKQRGVAPAKRGPRLTDLIDALEITSGQLALELIKVNNQWRQAEQAGEKHPGKLPVEGVKGAKTLKGKRDTLITQQIVANAYIDYLNRMKEALDQFMEKPQHRYYSWGGGAKDKITDNPPVRSMLEDVRRATDLFRRPPRAESPASFEVPMWNGQKVNFGQFAVPQSMIVEHYYADQVQQPGYADKVVGVVENNIQQALQFNREAGLQSKLVALREALPAMSTKDIVDVYYDIFETISKSRPAVPEEAIEQSRLDPEEIEFWQAQGMDHDDFILSYEKEFNERMEEARNSLINKYREYMADESSVQQFAQIIEDIRREEIVPFTPLDIRNLRTLSDQFTLKSTQSTRVKDVSAAMKNVLADVQEKWESPVFQAAFEKNEADLKAYEEEYEGEVPTDFVLSVQAGKEYLASPEAEDLRRTLGIRDLDTTEQDHRVEFSQMMNDVFYGKTKAQIQEILGPIPIAALYAYLSDRFLEQHSDHIACIIACRFGGAREARELEQQQREEGAAPSRYATQADCLCRGVPASPESLEQARKYVEGTLSMVKQKRGADDELAVNTAGGFMKWWHEAASGEAESPQLRAMRPTRDDKGQLDTNFAKVFVEWSRDGFGADFLRDESRKHLSAVLQRNKRAADEAMARGEKFVWDDPFNPRPTNMQQFMHMTGAFADPLAGEAGGEYFKKRSISVGPGETAENADRADRHVDRLLRKAYGAGGGAILDPIGHLRGLFLARRDAILEKDPEYASYIFPYDINKTITTAEGRTFNITNAPYDPEYGAVAQGLTAEPLTDVEEKALEVPPQEIRTRGDAIRFLDSLEENILPPRENTRLKEFIKEAFPDPQANVFGSTAGFYEYFTEDIAPLLGGDVDADAILDRITDLMQAPAPQRAPEPESPVEVGEEIVEIRRQLAITTRKLRQLVEQPVADNAEELQAQIQGMTEQVQLADNLGKQFERQSEEVVEAVAEQAADFAQAITTIKQEIAIRNQRLEAMEAAVFERERQGAEILRPIIDQILAIISGPEFQVMKKVPPKYDPQTGDLVEPATFNPFDPSQVQQFFNQQMLSLLGQGQREQAVHPEAIAFARETLNNILNTLQQQPHWTLEGLQEVSRVLSPLRIANFRPDLFSSPAYGTEIE